MLKHFSFLADGAEVRLTRHAPYALYTLLKAVSKYKYK
jgi:hypothetical protein